MSDKKENLLPEVGDPYDLFQRAVRKNYLAAAEMSIEENYDQIDGIINGEKPKNSVINNLKQCQQDSCSSPTKPHREPER